MEIELYEPPTVPPRVPAALVTGALEDARTVVPSRVHRTVALAVAHGSEKTARLRLERLARVVMVTDSRITDPAEVWAADWSALPAEAVEALDRGIRASWSSVSTRNAMRDSVRAVVRESLNAGILTHDQATPLLNAVRPEKQARGEEKQARGHVPASRKREVFHELAQDESLTARRDAALMALLVGAGLRVGVHSYVPSFVRMNRDSCWCGEACCSALCCLLARQRRGVWRCSWTRSVGWNCGASGDCWSPGR